MALTAGETHVGEVGKGSDVIDVTLTLDTLIYAALDVLSDTATLTDAVRVNGGKATLVSLTVIDEDDQAGVIDFYFFKATQSLGTKNAAPDIADAAARDILGIVSVAAADYKDLGGVKIASIKNINLKLEAATGSRNLFLGSINLSGTPTYTAAGVRVKLGIDWD